MKVIDLLVKIANGEEVPKHIKSKGMNLYWNEEECVYDVIEEMFKAPYYLFHNDELNDEIEIIEEKKEENKITPETIKSLGIAFGNMKKLFEEGYEEGLKEPKKIEKVNTYVICDSDFMNIGRYSTKATEIIDKAFEEYSKALNEIIDYINKGDTNE